MQFKREGVDLQKLGSLLKLLFLKKMPGQLLVLDIKSMYLL